MHIITNRQLANFEGGYIFDIGCNSPTNEVHYMRDGELITNQRFMDDLRNHPASNILFYIHGFNNLPDRAIEGAERLQYAVGSDTLVVPIIWPCDSDVGIIKDYWDDQMTVDMSGFAFARCFEFFRQWQIDNKTPCGKSINIMAHSMGNRVLRATLNCWQYYFHKGGIPTIFDNIYMVAADVRCDTLQDGNKGAVIRDAADEIHVFYNKRDLALKASKVSNTVRHGIKVKRLGVTGVEGSYNNVHNHNLTQSKMDDVSGHGYFYHDDVVGVVKE